MLARSYVRRSSAARPPCARLTPPAVPWRMGDVVPESLVAETWHDHGMARVRVSTTVDEHLLAAARRARAGAPDAALLDEALQSLLARHRAVEIDAAYTAYDEHPLDEADAWGDLASFREAAGAS